MAAFYLMVRKGLSEDVIFKPISEGQEQATCVNVGRALRHSKHLPARRNGEEACVEEHRL